jgi:hypothetical protein
MPPQLSVICQGKRPGFGRYFIELMGARPLFSPAFTNPIMTQGPSPSFAERFIDFWFTH